MNALVGGHIHLAFDNITFAWPQSQGGTVRAIAVTSKERSPTAPDVPAIAETFRASTSAPGTASLPRREPRGPSSTRSPPT